MACAAPCCPTFVVPPPAVCPCPTAPPVLPTIPPGVPSYEVNPCQPSAEPTCGPCVNVQVPVVGHSHPLPPIVPMKKCKYIQPARPKSFAPVRQFRPPEMEMENGTIYRKSYLPVEADRATTVRPRHNLLTGDGKFSNDTVHKMSFQGHNTKPACLILPCNHKLLGDGPMQDITTNKHDYVPKCQKKLDTLKPVGNLYSSDCPLSDKTTNRLSYLPFDTMNRTEAIRPLSALDKPCGPFEKNTIHNMSYQPWEPQPQMDMPWAAKTKYTPPVLRMSDDTVNRLSYGLPGTFVECDDSMGPCVPCPEPPCLPPSIGVPTCNLPCCCPKASC